MLIFIFFTLFATDSNVVKLKTIIPKSNKTIYIFTNKDYKLKIKGNDNQFNFSDSLKIVK